MNLITQPTVYFHRFTQTETKFYGRKDPAFDVFVGPSIYLSTTRHKEEWWLLEPKTLL